MKITFDGEVFWKSYNLGYAVYSRLEKAVNEGYLKIYPNKTDYAFTYKALSCANFWKWLQGYDNTLLNKVNLDEFKGL